MQVRYICANLDGSHYILIIRGAPDIVSGRIIRPDSRVMGLSSIRPVIFLYLAGYRIICFSEDNCQFVTCTILTTDINRRNNVNLCSVLTLFFNK